MCVSVQVVSSDLCVCVCVCVCVQMVSSSNVCASDRHGADLTHHSEGLSLPGGFRG